MAACRIPWTETPSLVRAASAPLPPWVQRAWARAQCRVERRVARLSELFADDQAAMLELLREQTRRVFFVSQAIPAGPPPSALDPSNVFEQHALGAWTPSAEQLAAVQGAHWFTPPDANAWSYSPSPPLVLERAGDVIAAHGGVFDVLTQQFRFPSGKRVSAEVLHRIGRTTPLRNLDAFLRGRLDLS